MLQAEVSYAQAILEVFWREGRAKEGLALLQEYAAAIQKRGPLYNFLKSPTVADPIKKETLIKLYDGTLPASMVHFLYLLVDRGRIGLMAEIYAHYERLFAKKSGILEIFVTSAFALSEQETGQLRQVFMKKYGAEDAWVKVQIDPRLLGGVRVQIGDMLYDSSLFGKMESLRREISAMQMA